MNKELLLKLHANGHLRPGDVGEADPELAEELQRRLEGRVQRKLARRLPDASDRLREAIRDVQVPLERLGSTPLRTIAVDALRERATAAGDDELVAEVERLAEEVEAEPDEPIERDPMAASVPLSLHPEFAADFRKADIYRLTDATALGDDVAETLFDRIGKPAELTDVRLADLVHEGKLDEQTATKVGRAVSLSNALDGRVDLVEAVAADGVEDARSLVAREPEEWAAFLERNELLPPGDLTVEDYADVLTQRFRRLYPAATIATRVRVHAEAVRDVTAGLQPLVERNTNVAVVGTGDIGELSTDGLDAGQLQAAETALSQAVALDNRFVGMGIADVLDDTSRDPADRIEEAARRARLATELFAANDDLLELDLTAGSADLDRVVFPGDADEDERSRMLVTARAYQRTRTVTKDPAAAELLVTAGFPSAVSVATAPVHELLDRVPASKAEVIRFKATAERIAEGVTGHVGTLVDLLSRPLAGKIAVLNQAKGWLKELPGFEDFFGRQSFCDCQHCQSILGPAAYFVDLMCFIDEHVTQPVFGAKPSHRLKLQNRRPDLWTLDLTCENTSTPIPYLVIVNEVLENAVAKDQGFAGDIAAREAVEDFVYRQTLPGAVHSFAQPLNLAFEQTRVYLQHFDRTLADVAEIGLAPPDTLARLRLGLPPEDFEIIHTPAAALADLRRVYGIQFTEAGGTIEKLDAQLLLPPMAVDRDALTELLATRFVTADGADHPRIVGSKSSAESIQNDVEHVTGLTRAVLDRLHRFVRLWRATGWRIGELDLALTHLREAGLGADLDRATLRGIATIHRWTKTLDCDVEQAVAIWSTIPRHAVVRTVSTQPVDPDAPTVLPAPRGPGAKLATPLFDRLFNPASLVGDGGSYPQPGTSFVHPALSTAPADDPNLGRLIAALGVTEGGLLDLLLGLAGPLNLDPEAAADADKAITLSVGTLSLLYRHALLSRILDVDIPELFALAALAPDVPGHVAGLEDLVRLVSFARWVDEGPWSIAELVTILDSAHPAVSTAGSAFTNVGAGEQLRLVVRVDGDERGVDDLSPAATGDLDALVADLNAQAAHTRAHRSDDQGRPRAAGDRLSIRSRATGGTVQIEITHDTASLLVPAVPAAVTGADLALDVSGPAGLEAPADAARSLVAEVAATGGLLFTDEVLASVPPTSPVAVSAGPVTGSNGESITVSPVLSGHQEDNETVTLGANPDLDEVVSDWNSQSRLVRAYRADAAGVPDDTGDRLAITIDGATGSASQLVVTADSAPLFTTAAPTTYTGQQITPAQSRAVLAANDSLWEIVDGEGNLRLVAGVDLSVPLDPAPADPATGTTPVHVSLEPAMRERLAAHHSSGLLASLLPSRVDTDPSRFAPLLQMAGVDLASDVLFAELRGDGPPHELTATISALRPLAQVFADARTFTPDRLGNVADHATLLGVTDFRDLDVISVRRLELLHTLLQPWVREPEQAPDVLGILSRHTGAGFDAADREELAQLLESDVAAVEAVRSSVPLAGAPFDALRQLAAAVGFCDDRGIGGAFLHLAQGTSYGQLAAAAGSLRGAMRADITDDERWAELIEPLEDELLTLRRDGLVAHLIHSGSPEFDETLDLYRYFLLDVELEGCARTSRIAAAIDTAQLYVHRCRMNLEETGPGDLDPVHVEPSRVDPDEWQWRQHYRVWEVNRKVFLYPENFIEPARRDNKTPLFEELEQELLSKDLDEEAIVEAYGRYLRGFDEVAHLTIAGSYHEKSDRDGRDVLHLLGVTADEPPTYYYRRVEDAKAGAVSDERATRWGAWQKVDAQIPVRKVSPVVHRGQLYVFWNRYTTKPINEVEDGSNRFVGYDHRGYLEFTKRRVDGSWTAPQGLTLAESPFEETAFPAWYHSDGVIQDRVVTKAQVPIAYDVEVSIGSSTIGRVRLGGSGQGFVWVGVSVMHIQLPTAVLGSTTQTLISIGALSLRVTPVLRPSLRAPLYDEVEHPEVLEGYTLRGLGWERPYPSSGRSLHVRGFNFQMASPVDLYRLRVGHRVNSGTDAEATGVPWSNPAAAALLMVFGRLSDCDIDEEALRTGRLVWSQAAVDRRILHSTRSTFPCFEPYAFASVLLHEETVSAYSRPLSLQSPWFGHPQWSEEVTDYLRAQQRPGEIGTVPADALLQVVNGSVGDVTIQTSRDALYLQSDARKDGRYHLRRLNTSLSEDVNDLLFNEGLDVLLATETQLALGEHNSGVAFDEHDVEDATATGDVDFDGSMGTYLREIFFHIPFLIADHFNSQGRFEEAQRWYHHIFDPTSTEIVAAPHELDRNWRYREFRGLDLDSLRSQLTNQAAIDAYRQDPFNPHAVARMRLSAYQKAVLMKYVDNLLDWGDHCFVRAFSQLNPELLREATLRYVTAQEILGDRPAQLGDCGEGSLSPKVFPEIKEKLREGSEFLMELESWVITKTPKKHAPTFPGLAVDVSVAKTDLITADLMAARTGAAVEGPLTAQPDELELAQFGADRAVANRLARASAASGTPIRHRLNVSVTTEAAGTVTMIGGPDVVDAVRAGSRAADAIEEDANGRPTLNRAKVETAIAGVRVEDAVFDRLAPDRRPSRAWDTGWSKGALDVFGGSEKAPGFGISIVQQISPIFCVPGNHRMLRLWDRVDDRLFKLRNCQDIDGVPRQLPLFAPQIDPEMLVAGRAAGLSLDDILSAAAGTLPPYRFRYLLDKAKAYAATVQSFGGALLSALEKRDAEALVRLRQTHQKNLLTLSRENKRRDLKVAQEGLEGVRRRQVAAQYRHDYFDGLVSGGLTALETTQTAARITSLGVKSTYALLAAASGVAHLVPQVGSPFSMKYGGDEIGKSANAWGTAAGVASGILDLTAEISGIYAGFERREQGWKHQKKLAANDLEIIEKDLAIAEIRVNMAQRALDIHEATMEQHDEVMDYFEDKFTNLGLYTHLSRTLQQLHREAYDNALALARQAEQAYRYERPADARFVVGGEWDAARSGLLAGERLGLALQGLERRYIETESRQAEINQSFSLTQIDPAALVRLKESGTCEFSIPEFFFDMYYPGQFRRRIKSVRLTIPCVTGPYTNVSARLTLLGSRVRQDPVAGEAHLFDVPLSGTTTVATSTAQGDAGVFELNFRSEKLMPFEGMGAVSDWRLELPGAFHPFDYRTINDAIINISYTADHDGALRSEIEADNAAVEGSLLAYLDDNTLTRVFSLRQEFSTAFTRLLGAPAATEVTFDLTDRHFPLMLQGRTLDIDSADVVLVPGDPGTALGGIEITLNGTAINGFNDAAVPPDDSAYAGLPKVDAGAALAGDPVGQHTIAIADPGGLAAPAGSSASLADGALRDVLLVVSYTLA